MNKTWLILIAVIGLAVLGAGVYFALNKDLTPAPVAGPGETANINIPAQRESARQPEAVSGGEVFFSWLAQASSSGEKHLFYLAPAGGIYKYENGKEELISDGKSSVLAAKASNDGKKILIKSGDSQALNWKFFDSDGGTWQTLKAGVLSADFSPDGKKIVFFSTSNGRSDLIVKDLSSSRQTETKIISLNQQDFDLRWLAPDYVFLAPKASSLYASEFWKINLKTKKISKVEGGLYFNWSAVFGRAVRLAKVNGQMVTDFIDEDFFPLVKFNFKTLPEKCLITGQSQVFCAVPKDENGFSSRALPDDYLKKNFYTEDSIIYLDLSDRSKSKIIYEGKTPFDAINLLSDGTHLYFINRYDEKLYSIAL